MIPISVRWAVFEEMLSTNDEEKLGMCYKFLTNQPNGKKAITNHILAIKYNCCDQRTLRRKGLSKPKNKHQ